MSILSAMTALADAVREKSGASGPLSIAGMEAAVRSIDTGSTEGTGDAGGTQAAPEPDAGMVNFVDFDGTVVERWSLAELAAKTTLPDSPSHEGLVSQGWNWTLEDLKASGKPNAVGQNYVTDDGKTRLHITLTRRLYITVLLRDIPATIHIDWGDGSQKETLRGYSTAAVSHSYAAAGDYMITIDGNAGSYKLAGFQYKNESNGASVTPGCYPFLKKVHLGVNAGLYNGCFQGTTALECVTITGDIQMIGASVFMNSGIRAVVIPPTATELGKKLFSGCRNLGVVSIPREVASVGQEAFLSCSGLRALWIPDGVTVLGQSAFSGCASVGSAILTDGITEAGDSLFAGCTGLGEVALPGSLAAVPASCFDGCSSLMYVEIGSGTVSLGDGAFSACGALKEIRVRAEVPPAGYAGMFGSAPSDLEIHVPAGSLESYQAAEHWSDYSGKMAGEEA